MAGQKNEVPFPKLRGPSSRPTQTVPEKKSLADLEAAYLRNRTAALELERLRQNPPQKELTPQQKIVANQLNARAATIGKRAGGTEVDLPGAITSANSAIKLVDSLLKHPGFSAAVGAPNPFKGGFGIGNIPGTPAGDFVSRLDRAQATAFMQARQSLKGAGQVTDFEGKRAETALSGMKTATSEEEFRRNAQEFADAIRNGVEIMKKQARMGVTPYTYDQLLAEKARRSGGK